MPNCVGWSPSSSGSIKWGYTTNITAPSGNVLTPQLAFSSYYFKSKDSVLLDKVPFPNNPSWCVVQCARRPHDLLATRHAIAIVLTLVRCTATTSATQQTKATGTR